MGEEGSVTPETVIHVLKTFLGDSNVKVDGNRVTVITANDPRVYSLAAKVTRRTVSHIANRHGIPIHLFYNPGMLAKGGEHKH